MRTVIFGGGGFVGLNIAQALLAEGRAVELADATAPPEGAIRALDAPPGRLRVSACDVRQPTEVETTLAGEVDAVVYGAAITADAARDALEPERILAVNLLGLVTVLRAARDRGVRRVINLSSSAAYGDAALVADSPLEEAGPVDPTGLYALSKFASERAARRLAALWQLDVRSVRLSGVFGRFERQTSDRDTPSPPYQVVRAARRGEPALLSRPGERDWIYAPDVAAAVLALLDGERLRHDLYNISTGQSFSVLAFGQRLAAHHPGFVCRLAEPGEAATIDLFADRDRAPLAIERITTDTAYRARFDLDGAVDDYHRWACAHADLMAADAHGT
jgi:UDP-glucose 4-epimerase